MESELWSLTGPTVKFTLSSNIFQEMLSKLIFFRNSNLQNSIRNNILYPLFRQPPGLYYIRVVSSDGRQTSDLIFPPWKTQIKFRCSSRAINPSKGIGYQTRSVIQGCKHSANASSMMIQHENRVGKYTHFESVDDKENQSNSQSRVEGGTLHNHLLQPDLDCFSNRSTI